MRIVIHVERKCEYAPAKFLSFSPDGTHILNLGRGICVWTTGGELIARLLTRGDETRLLSATYLSDERDIVMTSRNSIITNCIYSPISSFGKR